MISTSSAIYLSITLCVGGGTHQCRVVSYPALTFASPTVCANTAEIIAALEARDGEMLT